MIGRDGKRIRLNSCFTKPSSLGTPQTSTIGLITTTIFTKRGDLGGTPTFTQTDAAITHRYRFGADKRFTLAGDLNFINLWDEKNVTGKFASVTAAGINYPTFPQYISGGFPLLSNSYNKGQLLGQINTYLAGTPTALNSKDARYGQPNAFQGPRSVRFGVRFIFWFEEKRTSTQRTRLDTRRVLSYVVETPTLINVRTFTDGGEHCV